MTVPVVLIERKGTVVGGPVIWTVFYANGERVEVKR